MSEKEEEKISNKKKMTLICDKCGESLLNGNIGKVKKDPHIEPLYLCKECNSK